MLNSGSLHLAPGVRVPKRALTWTYARSAGPGGQNVNKRSTKAVLRIELSELGLDAGSLSRVRAQGGRYLSGEDGLVIASDEHRERARNRDACLTRLAALLGEATRPRKKRRATKPTRGSVERRLKQKKARSETKSRRRERYD